MIGTVNYATLFGTATGNDGLLGALYPKTGASQASDPVLSLRLAQKNQARDISSTEQKPDVKRDIASFKAAISKAKSPSELLSDPRFLKVLLTANGLGDQVAYPALARKALLSDPADKNSLLTRLSDTRWKTVSGLYKFATEGLKAISDPSVQSTVGRGYAEVVWRKSLDVATPGLSDSLTFRARAASVASVIEILGDPILRRVVTTALNIPQQIAFQSIATQERAISTRLDLAKLKDAHFVDLFSQRYLLAVRTNNAASGKNGLLI